jgi:predicted sulfurtransferase
LKTIQKNSITLIVILFSITALWFTNRTVTPKEATWKDVIDEAASGNYSLITTDELWKLFSTPGESPLIIDTRQEWEYRSGHIEGALNFPMEPTWLSRWQKRSALAQFLGPDKNKSIIFY